MYRVLITGGAGFIGSHAAEYLVNNGHQVTVVDNLLRGHCQNIEPLLQHDNFTFIRADAADSTQMSGIFRQHCFDVVFHLAANSDIQAGVKHPEFDLHHTLQTTLTVLECMRKFRVSQIIFSSSSAVYGFRPATAIHEDDGPVLPVSYYGSAKAASEAFIAAYCRMNKMQSWILRFPNVVGEHLTHGVVYDFMTRLKMDPGQLVILGNGRQTKPYIYIKDLLEAIFILWQNTRDDINYFNVGIESRLTVKEVADIVCREMGLMDVKYQYTGGNGGWLGDIPEFAFDLSKIQRLGWQARYSSEQAVVLAVRGNLS